MEIVAYGDDALLLRFTDCVKDEASAQIQTLALGLRGLNIFTEIVPAYDSLLVQFDPLKLGAQAAKDALVNASALGPSLAKRAKAPVEIPACYDDVHAPDMATACAALGLTRAQIIARHSAQIYDVCMLGFLPGFTFLSAVDPSLELPRHSAPRQNVAAGSIGIAGWQTGIYALNSPGGWQIIARTPLTLFDPAAQTPFRLSAGDRVKFTPISAVQFNAYNARK